MHKHKYKLGQKLYLNHKSIDIKYDQEAAGGILCYFFQVAGLMKDGYLILDITSKYSSSEPFDFVEDENNYLTKPTLGHILYA